MWRRSVSVVTAAIVAAGAGAVVGSAHPSAHASAHPSAHVSAHTSARTNRRLARADAARLLTRLVLPSGAVRSGHEPKGGGQVLAKPGQTQATPNFVDRHVWLTAPGSARALMSYIDSHRPAGATVVSSGTGYLGRLVVFETFGWPSTDGSLTGRWLVLEAVGLPGQRTGLRADGEDVWITPRPASERIPSRSTSLVVSVRRGGKAVNGPFTFIGSMRIGAATALINSLPAFQPGGYSCPADFGVDVRLVFRLAGARQPLAVADVDPQGCGGVGLRLRGRAQPPLASAGFPGSGRAVTLSLVQQLGTALGLPLPTLVQRAAGIDQ
jgi:hypothetical protein